MRLTTAVITPLLLASFTTFPSVQSKDSHRFGIDLDLKKYPQNSPKEALGSVVKAIAEKQFEYLLAHLADPAFVDQRVAQQMAKLPANLADAQKQTLAFDRLVKTTAESFLEDPSKFKELQRFHDEGAVEENESSAEVKLKNLQARKVILQKIAPDRWVLLDRTK
jgi:hypothetical protein